MNVEAHARPQLGRGEILAAAASLSVFGTGAEVLARLMGVLCNPKTRGNEIAGLIEQHPMLCASVLRVANSAYYGRQRSVTSLERAVQVLGLDAVRGIAAAACIDRTMARNAGGTLLDMTALLDHSLATALAAASLARVRDESCGSDAFIGGLIHNLGVAVQICADPPGVNAMAVARQTDREGGIRRLEAEHSSAGHEVCGAIVLDAWQLPHPLVAAAAYHHDPLAAPQPHRELAAIVSLAATVALTCGYTFSLESSAGGWDLNAMEYLGLGADDLHRVVAELPAQADSLRRALRVS